MSKVFEIGDKIVYPSYGLGVILNIESKMIYSIETKMYIISFNEGKVILSVPLQKSNILRNPISKDQAEEIYDILRQSPENQKQFGKINTKYEEKIKSGDLFIIAKTLRDVYKKNIEGSKAVSSYTYNQKRLLDLAIKLISDEICEAEKIDQQEAKNKIMLCLRSEAQEKKQS